jgi:hypothetical protein
MLNRFRPIVGATMAASILVTAAGCDSYLEVKNPTVIDASTVDPVADAPTFSLSALNNLFNAFDDFIVYGAWFSGEAWEGDTFPTRTDIARRTIDFVEGVETTNSTVPGDIYNPLARAISTGENVQVLLADLPDATSNINLVRATYASATGILFESELFCQTVISSSLTNLGVPLTSVEGAAAAEERFKRVITQGTAVNTPEALMLANAARVGLARALLFQGKNAEAVAAAGEVPASFEFLAPKVDDPSNRGALGNTVYSFTLSRQSLVVPPYYRALNDPRVTSNLTITASGPAKAQDNFFDFHRQTKYTGWGDDIRLASGLEARYLAAEAQLNLGNPAPALALIADRRAVGGAAACGDDIVFVTTRGTMTDLLDQKARDFFLEGTKMGDWRRNPLAAPYVPPAGSPYYNTSEGGVFGGQTCMPLPDDEILNNPNFNK